MGGGTPPILTDRRLADAVARRRAEGDRRHLPHLLVDPRRDDPSRMIATNDTAVLEPNPELTRPIEHQMYVRDVVFTTGIADAGDHYVVASGEADLACRITHIPKDRWPPSSPRTCRRRGFLPGWARVGAAAGPTLRSRSRGRCMRSGPRNCDDRRPPRGGDRRVLRRRPDHAHPRASATPTAPPTASGCTHSSALAAHLALGTPRAGGRSGARRRVRGGPRRAARDRRAEQAPWTSRPDRRQPIPRTPSWRADRQAPPRRVT